MVFGVCVCYARHQLSGALMRLICLLFLAFSPLAQASDVELSWQSRLLDANGAPLEGAHDIVVSIYNSDAVSQPAWTGSFLATTVESGFVSLTLGAAGSPLNDGILAYRPVEIGVAIGTGDEMSPRQVLLSVPYAVEAGRVSSVGLAETMIAAECTTNGVMSFLDSGPGSPALRVCVDGSWAQIWPASAGSTRELAGASCKTILDGGGANGDHAYWLDPNGGSTADAFEANCDMSGGGWTELQPEYDAYSWRNDTCGGAADSDCRPPSHGASRPHTQFGSGGAVTAMNWVDLNQGVISSSQLDALANGSTETQAPGAEVHTFDTEVGNSYFAIYRYYGGANLTGSNAETNHGVNNAWGERTSQVVSTYVEAGGRIPKAVDTEATPNWGYFLFFGDDKIRVR